MGMGSNPCEPLLPSFVPFLPICPPSGTPAGASLATSASPVPPVVLGSVRDPKSQFLSFPAQVASGGDPVCDFLPVPASSSVPNALESSVHSLDDPSLLFCTLKRYGRDSILLRMEGAWVQKDMVYLGGCRPRPPLSPPNQTSGLDKVTLVVEGRGRGQGDRAQAKGQRCREGSSGGGGVCSREPRDARAKVQPAHSRNPLSTPAMPSSSESCSPQPAGSGAIPPSPGPSPTRWDLHSLHEGGCKGPQKISTEEGLLCRTQCPACSGIPCPLGSYVLASPPQLAAFLSLLVPKQDVPGPIPKQ
ncbi:uncharacterized protein LOC125153969 [Prionailurus viverrinus]|uniref:uncharacterized protein LOC125153969 n=1 Tax=Prionailurus viverrinus TaxID=61388 RepID=UPI001FF5FFC9|nr:uncharacterized protein LOC125153969 [Prionailurus viverrinus]